MNQHENSRMDEENRPDKNVDVTRSEHRQAVANADSGDNAENTGGPGGHGHHGGNETGSHQEAQYDKNSAKPMVDKESMGEAGSA